MATERSFIDPHEVPTIPGTEGWEEMYPYYYVFGKGKTEREKYESNQFWFYDGVHYRNSTEVGSIKVFAQENSR